ncbi:hypothetical protein WDZ92_12440 [Nostoc sp. NIES-2111]
MRNSLIRTLALKALEEESWSSFDYVINELDPKSSTERMTLLVVIREAIEYSMSIDETTLKRKYFDHLLTLVSIEDETDEVRIFIAGLIYKATGNSSLAQYWLSGIKQPIVSRLDTRFGNSINPFMYFFEYNWLNIVINQNLSSELIPPVSTSDEDNIFFEFHRIILLLARLNADAILRESEVNFLVRVRPLIHFFYQNHAKRRLRSTWYQIERLAPDYFALLIKVIGRYGLERINHLTQYLLGEFITYPQYWKPEVKRSILVRLAEEGASREMIAGGLKQMETTMLDSLDVRSRSEACHEHAKAWIVVDDKVFAIYWLKRAMQDSFGIGYRKDYQLSGWMNWLPRIDAFDPEGASSRMRWFVSHIHHLKQTTEGPAYQRLAEKSLKLTLGRNLISGLELFIWLQKNGYIHFEDGLSLFIKSSLKIVSSLEDFNRLHILYTRLFVPLATTADAGLLLLFLERGVEILGDSFFETVAHDLILAIRQHGLEDTHKPLFTVFNKFLIDNSRETVSYNGFFRVLPSIEERDHESSNKLVLKDSTTLSEEEVIARIQSFDDLLDLKSQAENGYKTYFWGGVLKAVSYLLDESTIQKLSENSISEHENWGYFYALAEIAYEKGYLSLTREIAKMSLAVSSPLGWMEHWDGGSRKKPLELLRKAGEPNISTIAFDLFFDDASVRDSSSQYAESLDEILEIIDPKFNTELIWQEVFTYLNRLTACNKIQTDLPSLDHPKQMEGHVFGHLLSHLIIHPVYFIQRKSRGVLAELISKHDYVSLNSLKTLGNGEDRETEAFVEILGRLSPTTRNLLVEDVLHEDVLRLAVSSNYWVRRQIQESLKAAKVPMPTIPYSPLPPIYTLYLTEHLADFITTPTSTGRYLNKSDISRPLGLWIEIIANLSQITEALIRYRHLNLMRQSGNEADWSEESERGIEQNLVDTGLRFGYETPRFIAARTALMRVTTELVDAGLINEEEHSFKRLFTFRDYSIYSIPEFEKPDFIPRLQSQMKYLGAKEWMLEIKQYNRLYERMPTYGSDGIVIAEHTLLRGLEWSYDTEVFYMRLSFDFEHPDEIEFFGSLLNEETNGYYEIESDHPFLVLMRDHRFHQPGLKSNWIAINPRIARQLGWIPDRTKCFGWMDNNGEPMIESIYWIQGNTDMKPYHRESETGEGWFIVASKAGFEQIMSLKNMGLISRLVERSQNHDGELMEANASHITSDI